MELQTVTTKSTTVAASLSYHFQQEVSTEKCSQWLEKLSMKSIGDSESFTGTGSDDLDDGTSSMITDDCTDSVGGDSTTWLVPNRVKESHEVVWNDKTMLAGEYTNNGKVVAEVNTIFNRNKNIYSNVKINKSKKIHLGNVTYINGPVYIRQGQQQTEIENSESTLEGNLEGHTATDESFTQPGNILQVRLIQQFHIEGRHWSDIAYNYLIGSDGNVYEGRGFDTIGSHTFGYNAFSIGIAFIGFFTKKLPPEVALNQLRALLEYGVEIGAICPDYKLLAHSQCSTTESPGKALFEELSSWPHFDPTVNTEHPAEDYLRRMQYIANENYSNNDEIETNLLFQPE